MDGGWIYQQLNRAFILWCRCGGRPTINHQWWVSCVLPMYGIYVMMKQMMMMTTLNSLLTPASETRRHGCHLLHQWNNRSLSFSFTMFAISREPQLWRHLSRITSLFLGTVHQQSLKAVLRWNVIDRRYAASGCHSGCCIVCRFRVCFLIERQQQRHQSAAGVVNYLSWGATLGFVLR